MNQHQQKQKCLFNLAVIQQNKIRIEIHQIEQQLPPLYCPLHQKILTASYLLQMFYHPQEQLIKEFVSHLQQIKEEIEKNYEIIGAGILIPYEYKKSRTDIKEAYKQIGIEEIDVMYFHAQSRIVGGRRDDTVETIAEIQLSEIEEDEKEEEIQIEKEREKEIKKQIVPLIKLTNTMLFEVSKYFETFEDFKRLEMAIPKCKGNMSRFHSNPISLKEKEVIHFNNIETYHLYKSTDYIANSSKIKEYIVWHPISSSKATKERYYNKNVYFKYIMYTKYDRNEEYIKEIAKQKKNEMKLPQKQRHDYKIPMNVIEIEKECFKDYLVLQTIQIPSTVSKISNGTFSGATNFTSMTIECHPNIVIKDGILVEKEPEFEIIYLPTTLIKVNGKLFHPKTITTVTRLEIPDGVTKINETTFDKYQKLKEIQFPSTIDQFDHRWFEYCTSLTKIELSSTMTKLTPGAFSNYYVMKEIKLSPLTTSLPECCFFNCTSLERIINLEKIEHVGLGCFSQCIRLDMTKIRNVIREYKLKEEHKILLEKWTGLKIGKTIFNSEIDDWNIKTSVFDKKILNKSKLLFIMEDGKQEIFGCYFQDEIKGYSRDSPFHSYDNSFLFNLESKGRLNEPMKFEFIDTNYAYILYKPEADHLITFGKGRQLALFKHGFNKMAYCTQSNTIVNYHGIRCALLGMTSPNHFTLQKIAVLQMK